MDLISKHKRLCLTTHLYLEMQANEIHAFMKSITKCHFHITSYSTELCVFWLNRKGKLCVVYQKDHASHQPEFLDISLPTWGSPFFGGGGEVDELSGSVSNQF